jgi:hypothetical protein
MRIGLSQALAVIVVVASACATTHEPTGGTDAPVQLLVPAVLAWEPEGPFEINLAIANYTRMIYMAVEARVEASDVTVFRLDGTVACKTPRAVEKTYERWTVKSLQPGRHWELKRDVREYCRDLGPGVYRYEANYRANYAEEQLRSIFVAFLGPQGGKVLVREGASSMKYEDIMAAVEKPETATASAAASAAQPAAGEPTAAPAVAAEPTAAGEPATAPAVAGEPTAAGELATAPASEPAPSAAEIHACVDKELRDRGLNAYGDPLGTTYKNGNPPVDEYGRILYVASRNPAIRRACKVPKF